jgi:hypothetical protein
VPDEVKKAAAPKSLKERQRERLSELLALKQKILTEVSPHREAHDKIVNDPVLIQARKKIKEANALLAPVEEEIAFLARVGQVHEEGGLRWPSS